MVSGVPNHVEDHCGTNVRLMNCHARERDKEIYACFRPGKLAFSPLSHRNDCGLPRSPMIRSSVRVTIRLQIPVATSIAGHSLV
jgi:hypothetical protein